MADGIIAWREGKHSLESLLEEAATPGGIAAATMTAMDAAGYGRAVRQGVAAGLRRARANARQMNFRELITIRCAYSSNSTDLVCAGSCLRRQQNSLLEFQCDS